MDTLLALPAYIDPGSGSIILQALAAAAAAVAVGARMYWARVKNFFRRGGDDTAARTHQTGD